MYSNPMQSYGTPLSDSIQQADSNAIRNVHGLGQIQVQQMQMAEAQKEQARQAEIDALWKQSGGDPEKFYNNGGITRLKPDEAMAFKQKVLAQQAIEQKRKDDLAARSALAQAVPKLFGAPQSSQYTVPEDSNEDALLPTAAQNSAAVQYDAAAEENARLAGALPAAVEAGALNHADVLNLYKQQEAERLAGRKENLALSLAERRAQDALMLEQRKAANNPVHVPAGSMVRQPDGSFIQVGAPIEKPPQTVTPGSFVRQPDGSYRQTGTPTAIVVNTAKEKERAKGVAAGLGGLTPEAEEMAAQAAEKGIEIKLPPMGMGSAGAATRVRILNKMAADLKARGGTVSDIGLNAAARKSSVAELTRLKSQRGQVMSFARTAELNIDNALRLAEGIPDSEIPIINAALRAGAKNITGDPKTAAFYAALMTGTSEYAKVVSSATGGGQTSDASRRETADILSKASTVAQLREIVSQVIRPDLANRKQGYDEQIQSIQTEIYGKPTAAVAGGRNANHSQAVGFLDKAPTRGAAAQRLRDLKAQGWTDADLKAIAADSRWK